MSIHIPPRNQISVLLSRLVMTTLTTSGWNSVHWQPTGLNFIQKPMMNYVVSSRISNQLIRVKATNTENWKMAVWHSIRVNASR